MWVSEVWPRLIEQGRVEAVACVDINTETFGLAKDNLNLSKSQCYTDIQQAFRDHRDADFVVMVVPPAAHEAVVDVSLEYDMHILSEKPIADTMEACSRIYNKVMAADKKMAVTMSHRFDQDKQTLEREIKSGRYGPLHYIVGRNTWNCRKYPAWSAFRYKIRDPLLVEATVHHFDIIRALAGANAKTVYAVTWNPPWGDFAGDPCGLITIEMENGVRAIYEGCKVSATTLNNWCHDYFRAECELATLELNKRQLNIMSEITGEYVDIEKPLARQPIWKNEWLAELFIDWLENGTEPPNSLRDNIHCAALVFAAVRSAHTHKPVEVNEFLQEHLQAAD